MINNAASTCRSASARPHADLQASCTTIFVLLAAVATLTMVFPDRALMLHSPVAGVTVVGTVTTSYALAAWGQRA